MDGRTGGLQCQSGRGGEKEKNPCSCGNETPVVQPVASSLYGLSYPGFNNNNNNFTTIFVYIITGSM
jgi:hypothetical protein